MSKLKRRKTGDDLASQFKSYAKRKKQEKVFPEEYIPTGCTLLNLALTDIADGGWKIGTISNIIGDWSSGKTFLLWTSFAEMLGLKKFKEYSPIFDEPESAFSFNARKLFGERIEKVIFDVKSFKPGEVDNPECSRTIQSWYRNVLRALKKCSPFLYGLDSFDALASAEEKERAKKLIESDKLEGSYNMEKQKISGQILRDVASDIKGTKSVVLVISQTRHKLGVTFGKTKTRAGGDALHFYSTHEVWLSVVKHLYKKDLEIGVEVQAFVEKNKVTGKRRKVRFQIFYDYGIDDIGSMIDWMVDEKFWSQREMEKDKEKREELKKQLKKKGKKPPKIGTIDTGGDFINGKREELIQHIEEGDLEEKLRQIVQECWNKVEDEIGSKRKPKYE